MAKKTNKFIGALVVLLIILPILTPILSMIGILLMWWRTKWSRKVKIILTFIGIILCVIYFSATFVFYSQNRPFVISGNSMAPNYKSGSYYLSNNYSPSIQLKRGDVIILKGLGGVSNPLDKRVIGLPGDKIMLNNGDVYLNGEKLTENYVTGKTYPGNFLKDGQEITIPKNNYFVMGDNRMYSSDSREWGFVLQANITNILTTCYLNCK